MSKADAVRNDGRGSGSVLDLADMGDILTSREARGLLRIGRTKLHELTRQQIIPAYRIGKGKTSSLRYRRSALLEWLYSQKV